MNHIQAHTFDSYKYTFRTNTYAHTFDSYKYTFRTNTYEIVSQMK